MKKRELNRLRDMIDTPSPSGCESAMAALHEREMRKCSNDIRRDTMGNVFSTIDGRGDQTKIMICAHIDEIGFMVTYIDDAGYLWFSAVGGVDDALLPGSRLRVHTHSGDLLGIIGRKPKHILQAEGRSDKVTPIKDLFVDLGMPVDEVRKRVHIGDEMTFDAHMEAFGDGFIVSRALDNKVHVLVMEEVAKRVAKRKRMRAGSLIACATVQEELGMRGATPAAYSANPDIAIVLDVCHATDYPSVNGKEGKGKTFCGHGPGIRRGPNISPVLFDRLTGIADKRKLPYQIIPEPSVTGTDGRSTQVNRSGVPTVVLSVPLRYMHTQSEVIAKKDVDILIELLVAFIEGIEDDINCIPW